MTRRGHHPPRGWTESSDALRELIGAARARRRHAVLRRGGDAQARARAGGRASRSARRRRSGRRPLHRARRRRHDPHGAARATPARACPCSRSTTARSASSRRSTPTALGRDFDRAFAGDFEILQLPDASTSGGPQNVWTAINDISVHRKPGMRVADLSYGARGRGDRARALRRPRRRHAAGSTGYNLANGGPVLAWGVRGLRRVVHRAALADRARARRRPGRPADDQQRQPRGGRRGPRRRPPGLRAARRRGHPRRVRPLVRDARAAPGRELLPPPARAFGRLASRASQLVQRRSAPRPRSVAAAVRPAYTPSRRCSTSCASRTCC